MSWSPSIRSWSSSRPATTPTTRCCSGRRSAAVPIWGDIELAWRLRDKVDDARRVDLRHRNERQDHDDPADRRDARRRRAAGRAGRQHRHPRARRDPRPAGVRRARRRALELPAALDQPERGGRTRPAGERLPQYRRRPPRLARLGGGLPRRQGEGVLEHPGRLRLQPGRPSPRANWSRTPRCRRGAARSASGWTCPGPSDLGVVEDFLVDRAFLEERHSHALELGTLEELSASGLATPHGIANALAAAALARAAGVEPAAVRDAIRDVPRRPPPHRAGGRARRHPLGRRLQGDQRARGARVALPSFESVVWIVGGLLKGIDPAPLVERHASRLRGAVIIGIDRSELAVGVPATRARSPGGRGRPERRLGT